MSKIGIMAPILAASLAIGATPTDVGADVSVRAGITVKAFKKAGVNGVKRFPKYSDLKFWDAQNIETPQVLGSLVSVSVANIRGMVQSFVNDLYSVEGHLDDLVDPTGVNCGFWGKVDRTVSKFLKPGSVDLRVRCLSHDEKLAEEKRLREESIGLCREQVRRHMAECDKVFRIKPNNLPESGLVRDFWEECQIATCIPEKYPCKKVVRPPAHCG